MATKKKINTSKVSAGGGNGGEDIQKPQFLVSKLMIAPSRKFGLPNYSSVDCHAGMEIVFDTPQPINSKLIREAFQEVHDVLRMEFRKQYNDFGVPPKKTE